MSESPRDSQQFALKNARSVCRMPYQRAESCALRVIAVCLPLAACVVVAGTASGDEIANATMQGLDEQVQEIKSDVLAIAAELTRLEEKLLYPSDTQVSVFVSLAAGDESRLDSVEILLDGEPVARHIYSFKELEALQKGGVQRLYTGNLATGDHRLDVKVAGKLPGGRDFAGAETFEIEKAVAPKLVEIELAARELGGPRIRIGDD